MTCRETLYLDEPLGALDALMRLSMRAESRRLLGHKRCTTSILTHDVEEALLWPIGDHLLAAPCDHSVEHICAPSLSRPLSHRHTLGLKGHTLRGWG